MSAETDSQPARPVLRVVRGEPDDVELAALIAVVSARAASAPAGGAEAETSDSWRDRAHLVRRPLTPGPGAWRASAWWF